MATQRITIAKVVGVSAELIVSRFRIWTEARLVNDLTEWSPGQWPEAVRIEVDEFVSALRENSHRPPVVYLREHIDQWSMGDRLASWMLSGNDNEAFHLLTNQSELWCFQLSDNGSYADSLREQQSDVSTDHQEESWFRAGILEAAEAREDMPGKATILVVRRILGGLVDDHEVEQSIKCVPDWLSKYLNSS